MARRNLFQPPPPPTPAAEAPAATRFPNTGAMSGMKSTLRDMSTNAVREIDPDLIEDDGPKDRLAFGPEAVADLAESIRHHGQQVPIMVRPLRDRPGRYQVVYGRRRLAALRLLGQPARAMVRTLDDRQAILAQGQENSLRLDPSFIEKAMFVTELHDSGHAQEVILEALAIDKPMLSRMQKVARSLPTDLIQAIGPAHGIGRRRWEELADMIRSESLQISDLAESLAPSLQDLGSDDRFARVARAVLDRLPSLENRKPVSDGQQVLIENGRALAQVKSSKSSLTLKVDAKSHPEFAAWLAENAEEQLRQIYALWSENQG